MKTYDDAFTALMGNEGDYSNNPADPGGETMYGITKRVARANGYDGEMRDLPLETAKAIAKKQYWDKMNCDTMDIHLAFQIFDTVYNGGHPTQWLQRAVGVTEDGVLGPATLAAIAATDVDKVIMRFDAYRLQYLAELKAWPTFGHGWVNRIANNLLKGAE